MARILYQNSKGFAQQYQELISIRGDNVDEASQSAKQTIDLVRAKGFAALQEFSNKYDNYELTPENFKITSAQIDDAVKKCDSEVLKALEVAAKRIADFHEKSLPKNDFYEDADGIGLGWRWGAVDAAGLYAPGGLAAYPSSVLMNAVPAKVAGVKRIIMATPPHKLHENPAILAAAKIAGIDEIFGAGGAQAIAAMAYGAGELKPVDVIVGPGNAYVSAAKKLVFGDVGIDSIAGPSEVFIIADKDNNPKILACDLLAQAEHDEMAQSILFTDSADLANSVNEAVLAQIKDGKAGKPAAKSWEDYGAIIIVENLLDACELINQGAPEHLEIATQDPDAILPLIRHSGSIFIGHNTPESLGDYVAGPNHVLPTGRRARFSSGLSVLNFMKRTTLLRATMRGLEKIGPYASVLARSEGLPAHGLSVDLRLEE
ncbi:MAG: histidinol dehydrogenase [Caulobacterales bacterium]|nr:histidinol dehydrogenase [Caulobacterales bacterium]MCA0373829.1 histidinol dehydrogenase [Pseudomonadota bacterium]